jgi:hypothetical protein
MLKHKQLLPNETIKGLQNAFDAVHSDTQALKDVKQNKAIRIIADIVPIPKPVTLVQFTLPVPTPKVIINDVLILGTNGLDLVGVVTDIDEEENRVEMLTLATRYDSGTIQYPTKEEFPAVGDPKWTYVNTSDNTSWIWYTDAYGNSSYKELLPHTYELKANKVPGGEVETPSRLDAVVDGDTITRIIFDPATTSAWDGLEHVFFNFNDGTELVMQAMIEGTDISPHIGIRSGIYPFYDWDMIFASWDSHSNSWLWALPDVTIVKVVGTLGNGPLTLLGEAMKLPGIFVVGSYTDLVDVYDMVMAHVNNGSIHVTQAQKNAWTQCIVDLASEVNRAIEREDELQDAIDEKQDTLVSGTTIKTINDESILGSGNIVVGGGDVPDATPTVKGKAKLFDTVDGVATDGAVTQQSVRDLKNLVGTKATIQYSSTLPDVFANEAFRIGLFDINTKYNTPRYINPPINPAEIAYVGATYYLTGSPTDTIRLIIGQIWDIATQSWIRGIVAVSSLLIPNPQIMILYDTDEVVFSITSPYNLTRIMNSTFFNWSPSYDDRQFFPSIVTDLIDKVDKVDGKGLSTNDLTDELKATYDGKQDQLTAGNNVTLAAAAANAISISISVEPTTLSTTAPDYALAGAQETATNIATLENADTQLGLRIDAVDGKGSLIGLSALGDLAAMTEDVRMDTILAWAMPQIWEAGGEYTYNSTTPSASTYVINGVTHTAAGIFNGSFIINAYNEQNDEWLLVNTPTTTPPVFMWMERGDPSVGAASDSYAGVAKLFNTANGTATDGSVTQNAVKTALGGKQDTLVGSGAAQNIKTVGGTSILGTGDIPIGGGDTNPEYTFVCDTDAKLAQWAAATPAIGDNTYESVLVVGELSLSKALATTAAMIDLNTTRTKRITGVAGSSLTFSNTASTIGYGIIGQVTGSYPNLVDPGKDYNITGVTVIYAGYIGSHTSSAFYNCANLTNCSGDGDSVGFYNCVNLSNCIGTGYGYGFGYAYGFYNCANLSNCSGSGIGSGNGYGNGDGIGFYDCVNLSNCTGSGTVSSGYGYGYGFSSCKHMGYCKPGSTASTTTVYNACYADGSLMVPLADYDNDNAAHGWNSCF